MQPHKIVSHDEWLAARKAHLADEKAFTRARDALSRKRRELPWEKVDKNYVFDAPDGKETLADLFGGKSQLIVYHFMLGPDWEQGCPSCSFLADHFDGAVSISRSATSPSSSSRARRCRRSRHSRSAWAGASNGCRRSPTTSTTTTTCRSRRRRRRQARPTTTTRLDRVPERGAPRRQRVLQERDGRDLPYLFELRPRPRHSDRRLQLPRHRAERP